MSKGKYNRIKVKLVEKGITNKELAEHLNMNINTVSRWCTNNIQPPLETLYKIADYLDINICELLVPNKQQGS